MLKQVTDILVVVAVMANLAIVGTLLRLELTDEPSVDELLHSTAWTRHCTLIGDPPGGVSVMRYTALQDLMARPDANRFHKVWEAASDGDWNLAAVESLNASRPGENALLILEDLLHAGESTIRCPGPKGSVDQCPHIHRVRTCEAN